MDRTDPVALEEAFGDPYDPANPLSDAALATADEQGVACFAAERLLDGVGFQAELVPSRWGGRLDDVEQLLRRVRPIFRRDPALGYRYCLGPFAAGAPVWYAGTAEQQRRLARLLLHGGGLAAGIHDLPDDDRDVPDRPLLSTADGRLRLDGRRPYLLDLDRADVAVLLVPTAGGTQGNAASVVLVDLVDGRAGTTRRPRGRLLGLRGCSLGDLVFDGRDLDGDELVGPCGAGAQIASATAAVNACVAAGAGVGTLDAGLFAALRFARHRRLYGQRIADMHHVRSTLATAFCHLLAADALVSAAARALRVDPDHAATSRAAAAHHLAPLLVEEGMNLCSVVLGARFYLRGQEYSGFGRSMRALPVLALRRPDEPAWHRAVLNGFPDDTVLDDSLVAALSDTQLSGAAEQVVDDGRLRPRRAGDRSLARRWCLLLAIAAVRAHVAGSEGTGDCAEATTAVLTARLEGHEPHLSDDEAAPVFAELQRRAERGVDFCLAGDAVRRVLAA